MPVILQSDSLNFLDVVNRILRLNAIIRGDNDGISSFSDTQHNASLNLAIVCVQDELVNLIADRLIPAERKTSGTITEVASQRTYSLASDFLRFYGQPHLSQSSENLQIYEWPGGLEALQIQIFTYATDTGEPNWWYFEPTQTKKIGLFQVPSSSGEVWSYEYQASSMVELATDFLPFHNDEENFAFTTMASRRFKYHFEDIKNQLDIMAVLEKDRTYLTAKATLMNLINGKNPTRSYANYYS